MEDRMYLSRPKVAAKPLLSRKRYAEDVTIDFDDEVSTTTAAPSMRRQQPTVVDVLLSIDHKLDKILSAMAAPSTGLTDEVNAVYGKMEIPQDSAFLKSFSMGEPVIEGAQKPAAPAAPRSSMLEEIQATLAAQHTTASEAGGDVVSDVCTLPASAYDDDI